MKISAVVAEYNPLHLGHAYHLQHVRTLGDAVVVVLAGNFVQRGEGAILDKYTRARHAIEAGADLVLELPTAYSISCAEQYAKGSVKLLANLQQDVVLSFGSECGDVELLRQTADIVASDNEEIQSAIRAHLAQGISFPTARQMAIAAYAQSHGIQLADLTAPNNILGIEYARANRSLEDPIRLDTIPRTFAYRDEACSASAIRNALERGETPSTLYPAVKDDLSLVKPSNDVLYLAAWRAMTKEQAGALWGADEGLHNRVWDCMNRCSTYADCLAEAATKRYTSSRIKRLATAGLLGLTDRLWREGDALPPYYNVLAMREDKKELLPLLAARGEVYTSHLDLTQSKHPFARLDAKADEVFELLRSVKMPTHFSLVK